MKYIIRVHFEWPDGTPDTMIISADTLKKLREIAWREIKKRHGKNPWSENIK